MKDLVFNLAGLRKYDDEKLGIRGLTRELHLRARNDLDGLLYSEEFWHLLQRLRDSYHQEIEVTHIRGQTIAINPTILIRSGSMEYRLMMIDRHCCWYHIVFVD